MPEISTDITRAAKDAAKVAKDATYVVIGAGVLGFQKAQVQRHQLMKRIGDPKSTLEGRVSSARTDLNDAFRSVDLRVDDLAERVEGIIERVEAAVAPFEDRLPGQARGVAKQVHAQAKEVRSQFRTLLPTSGS